MSLESRNLVTEKEFGPELAGQRVGWSAVTGYGRRPDEIAAVHIATTTIGENGATLEYEPREKDGEATKAYWFDAAAGFIATGGISIIIDRTKAPKEQQRIGPYHAFGDVFFRGSSDGRVLRLAGEGHSNEEELEEKRVWAENPAEVIANTEAIMDHEGLKDYYPTVYYTVNILLAHERYRAGSDLGELATAAAILPDAHMHETTGQELQTAGTIEKALSDEHREDEKMLRNLSVFGDVPAKDIPDAFAISRNKVSEFEQHAITAEKELYTQTGIFLPIGFHGGRSWPYMNASLPPTDERAYHRELHDLQNGRTKLAERELERERDELETRIEYASQGVAALKLLSRVEEAVSDSRYCLQLVKSLQEQESARTRDK